MNKQKGMKRRHKKTIKRTINIVFAQSAYLSYF